MLPPLLLLLLSRQIFVVLMSCLQILRMSISIIINSSFELIISIFNTSLDACMLSLKLSKKHPLARLLVRSPPFTQSSALKIWQASNNHRHLLLLLSVLIFLSTRTSTHQHTLSLTPLSLLYLCRHAFHLYEQNAMCILI